ncbi:helix-turn-helix domain-containing protein [Thermococcus zilligii]|uniref:ArsR family transcriptional regulator n=1 Tax=Thermococcus zilligii TaxID=54076 RepID=UPI00029A54CE|nr:ArsR family transcriptional regulator [Thermococcus zilligii]
MSDEDLAREVQELRKALEAIRASFEVVSRMAQAYLRLLNVYAEYGGLGIDVVIPEIKHDPIAREIVKVLFDLRRANVSQIARELRGRRGKASRNTVRAKLEELERLGIVREIPAERGRVYALSRDVVKRWLEMIGMPIRFEQTNDYWGG